MSESIHVRRLAGRRERTTQRLLAHARQHSLSIEDLPSVKLEWYTIRNAEGDAPDRVDEVFLFDEIGGSFGITAKDFIADIQRLTAPTIHLRINSPGGEVWEAIAIHSALLHHPSRIVTYVDSLAASAASVIAMAGNEIVMMPGSQLMIHDASAVEDGNPADHAAMEAWLGRQSDNISTMYAERAGETPEYWRELMRAETWLFAQEAVDIGLADRLVTRRPQQTDDVTAERMARTFDLSTWGYKYRGRENAPIPGTARVRRSATRTAPRTAAESGVGEMSTVDRAGAAQLRAEALSKVDIPPRLTFRLQDRMPGSCARSLPFAAPRMGVEEVTRNGTTYFHVFGQATVYDVFYDMWDEFGPYTEVVDYGSGAISLASNPDVAFLENHRGLTMARTTNNTLELRETSGLDVDAWLNPKRDDCQRLASAIDDRLITEMSFAFLINSGWWNDDYSEFHIALWDIHRGDVSAVNYGANPFTSIAARSREVFRDLDHMTPAMARAAIDRLSKRTDVRRGHVVPAVPSNVQPAPSTKDTPAARQIDDSGRTLASVEHMLAVWDEEDRRRVTD